MRAYVATWPGGPLAFVVTTRLAREFVDEIPQSRCRVRVR